MTDYPLRLAYFSPLPPVRSGIADYSRELLPNLARLAAITLYIDQPQVEAAIQEQFTVRPLAAYPQERWEYDAAVYHVGNSSYHEGIYQTLHRYPGVVVLHDFGLHHFMAHRTIAAGHYEGYTRELAYALGVAGSQLARAIQAGRAQHPLFEVPLSNRVVDLSLGLIVHSQYAAGRVRRQQPQRLVQVIPHVAPAYVGVSRRQQLGLPEEAVLLASAGQVTAAKQLELILRVFRKLRQSVPQAYFLIVGEVLPEVNLAGLVDELGLAGAVLVVGYVDGLAAFTDWVATADVVLNLRYPTIGETSGSALRAMAAARPLIVFDTGWYSELPDDISYKVPPLDEVALLAAMGELATSAEKRQAMGRRAAAYVREVHDGERAAGLYVSFIQRLLAGMRG
ncbi:MAG: glycosyltransferase family 4 protein [Chloroflexota bacterium]